MFNIFKNSASSILASSPPDDVRYFPKDFPSDNILNGNFPNVHFPKGQFPKGQVRPLKRPRLQWAREQSAVARMSQGAKHCSQNRLGIMCCGQNRLWKSQLGKLHNQEIATWKNTVGKLLLVIKPLGKYLSYHPPDTEDLNISLSLSDSRGSIGPYVI